jgi:uncharacterized protein (DUF2147 family)
MRPLLPLSLLLCTAAVAFAAAPSTGVAGDWTTTNNSIVHVGPCGSDVCLTIVRIPPTIPNKDIYNPDTSLRNRSVCGLTVGTGFHQDGPGKLTDGHLYDPKSGHTYRGTITAEGDTLHLRGYIGISLFGRSEDWHRSPPVPTCKA